MERRRKALIPVASAGIAGAIIAALAVQQALVFGKAHSTFENYYAFRGCTQLLQRSPESGVCRLADGKVIKIVRFRGRWYLDNDLPLCLDGMCL